MAQWIALTLANGNKIYVNRDEAVTVTESVRYPTEILFANGISVRVNESVDKIISAVSIKTE